MRSSVVVGDGAPVASGSCANATAGSRLIAACAGTTIASVAIAQHGERDRERHRKLRATFVEVDFVMFNSPFKRREARGGGRSRGNGSRRDEARGYEQPDEPAESHHEHAAHDGLEPDAYSAYTL